jgi:hypothetical protein
MNPRLVRSLAAGTAALSALLYYLIGFGALDIGRSTSGPADLLGFGLSAGTAFLGAGVLVLVIHHRWLVALVALMDVAVIVGYFAMAGIRVPPYEIWGLSIKVAQVAFLVALGYLLIRGEQASTYSKA